MIWDYIHVHNVIIIIIVVATVCMLLQNNATDSGVITQPLV